MCFERIQTGKQIQKDSGGQLRRVKDDTFSIFSLARWSHNPSPPGQRWGRESLKGGQMGGGDRESTIPILFIVDLSYTFTWVASTTYLFNTELKVSIMNAEHNGVGSAIKVWTSQTRGFLVSNSPNNLFIIRPLVAWAITEHLVER